ncbi:MAG: DUF1326 domain-containing protein [Actinomycetota bacterium]
MSVRDTYHLEGSVLDVYEGVPFWFDGPGSEAGSMSVTAWLIDKGEIAGIGVSDTAVVTITTRTPGGSGSRRLILVEEEAAPEAVRWVVDAFQGRLGGELGRLAGLAGEHVGYYQVPINYRLEDSKASLSVPGKVRVLAGGRRIENSHPAGSAAPWRRGWIGNASVVQVEVPEFQMVFDFQRSRVVRGMFKFAS